MEYKQLTEAERAELENLYTLVREYEGYLLPIGRHANLCQWLYEHGFGNYHNDKQFAMKLAEKLINSQDDYERYAEVSE
jgi:hypothetical protein